MENSYSYPLKSETNRSDIKKPNADIKSDMDTKEVGEKINANTSSCGINPGDIFLSIVLF